MTNVAKRAHAVPGAGRLRALVVDDRRPVVGSVAEFLDREEFVVQLIGTGEGAVRSAIDHDPDVVVLDLAIPNVDALEVCRQLRAVSNAYLVVLSARQGVLDAIGSPIAADDFITGPISPRELVTRIRDMVRRPACATSRAAGAPVNDAPGSGPRTFGGLQIDVARRHTALDGTPLALTRIEFEVLAALTSRAGAVLTRKQLLAAVWGESCSVCPEGVDVHIGHLRRKLGDDPAAPRYVITVRGSGYRFGAGTPTPRDKKPEAHPKKSTILQRTD